MFRNLLIAAGNLVYSCVSGTTDLSTDTEQLDSAEPISRIFVRLGAGGTYRQIGGNPYVIRADDGNLVLVLDSGKCAGREFILPDGTKNADLHPTKSPAHAALWVASFHGQTAILTADTDAKRF